MTHGSAPTEYKDIFVFLAAAGVLVPLFNRLKVSPVLGFLAAGVLLGPDGLGRLAGTFEWVDILTISDRSQIAVLAELGVVFLMFTIGLELSWERLKSMRRLVFGMGMAQILVCAAMLGVLFYLMGRGVGGALVLGFALALSSTAVVMPVMAERGRLSTTAGRSTFSVLLAQDLAVAPILIMVAVLGSGVGDDGLSPAAIGQAVASLLPSVVGVGLLVVLGRVGLRPMFRSVARAKNTEMFLATCLFVVLGTVFLAQFTGLSPAVGALVAGLLIAETEFRREVEVTIEPFKGLLLGVFFVSVGVGLDLDAVAVDAEQHLARLQQLVELLDGVHLAREAEIGGVLHRLQDRASEVGIFLKQHRGRQMPRRGVDGVTEQQQLHHRNDDDHGEGHAIAAKLDEFLDQHRVAAAPEAERRLPLFANPDRIRCTHDTIPGSCPWSAPSGR